MTTKNFQTATFTCVETKSLPDSLRNLVKQTGKRPSTVEVQVTTGPIEVPSYWRTEKIITLGTQGSVSDDSYVGSDGESNSLHHVRCTAPAAHVASKCGRAPCSVTIYVGNVSDATLAACDNARRMSATESERHNALLVAADESLTNAGDAARADASLVEAQRIADAAAADARAEAKRAADEAATITYFAAKKAARAAARENEHESFLAQLGI